MRVPEGPQPSRLSSSEGGGRSAGCCSPLLHGVVPFEEGFVPPGEAASSPGAQDRGSLSVKFQPELPGGYFP